MPSDFSKLDEILLEYPEVLRSGARIIAAIGEDYVRAHGDWSDDTQSLRDSITGFEALTEDPYKNFGRANWAGARSGAIQSKYPWNKPENYEPIMVEEDLGENEHPVAVVTAFVRYATDEGHSGMPFRGVDTIAVENSFLDALNAMYEGADDAFTESAKNRGII